MDNAQKRYWFHAKTYGFGWTLPTTWEGWAVLAVYFALLFGGLGYWPEGSGSGMFMYIGLITAALIVICWLKGERLSWRWGRHDS